MAEFVAGKGTTALGIIGTALGSLAMAGGNLLGLGCNNNGWGCNNGTYQNVGPYSKVGCCSEDHLVNRYEAAQSAKIAELEEEERRNKAGGTTQNADLLTRITQIYPANIISELKEVRKTDVLTGISITGYVSVPSYTRSSKKSIYTFVNSRTVKCPILLKAIDIAYKNMLPNGRYPFVVLNIDINPSEIDVNAHPTKRQIRYLILFKVQ